MSGVFTSLTLAKIQSPNRNRLLYEGVSGRARNAKPGNRREPEPPPQHRKGCSVACGGGVGAGGQRAELRTYETPAQCGGMHKEEVHLKFFMCVIQSRQLVRTPQRTDLHCSGDPIGPASVV